MDKKEMEEFADLVVNKLIGMQKNLDEQFIASLEKSNVPVEVHHRKNEKELLIEEIRQLIFVLKAYENSEDYEKASACKERILQLENKLSTIQ